MNPRHRAMSEEVRAELIDAIQMDRIENASAYAEEFAARHDLNPETVRSAISRFRRELGMLKRRPRRKPLDGMSSGYVLRPWTAVEVFLGDDVSDPELVDLGAAVLVRYEEDVEFRGAVDAKRPEIEEKRQRVAELRKMATELSPAEKAELLRILGE